MRLSIISKMPALLVALALVVGACGEDDAGGATAGDSSSEGESISLRLSNALTANNQTTTNWVLPFIEKAEELSDGRLTIEHFSDAQLGDFPDSVTVLQNGVADLSLIPPANVAGQMPLSNAFNLPRMGSLEEITEAYYEVVMDPETVIHKTDLARNDLVPLAVGATPAYQIVTRNKPIESPESLKGLVLRSTGGALDEVVKALGAQPVATTSAEQYQVLERGTVDGGIFNLPALLSGSLQEVTDHATLNADVGGFNFIMAASQSKWDELPEWAREALLEAGEYATDHRVSVLQEEEQKILDELSEGLTFYEFDDAELARLDEMLEGVAPAWVREVSAEGVPAEEALAEAREAVARAQGQ
jgi:TRAP-type C4-dicarboxylate transport system substrate-binding protein